MLIDSRVESYKDLFLADWYPYLISIKAPIALGIGYLLVVKPWGAHNAKKYKDMKPPKTGPLITLLAAIHNLALLVFSFLTFIHTAPVMKHLFQTQGVDSTLCDLGQNAWKNGLFYWGWLFYLSKYYEFIDTLIILVKGRVPMFLQTYHHTGAIFGMWILIASESNVTWIFVCLNSFIHTIMYFYYLMTTLNIRPPGKQIITYLQMIQFCTGNTIAFYTLSLDDCMTNFSRLACWFNLVYVTPMLYLFAQFAKKAYFKPKAQDKVADKKKQ